MKQKNSPDNKTKDLIVNGRLVPVDPEPEVDVQESSTEPVVEPKADKAKIKYILVLIVVIIVTSMCVVGYFVWVDVPDTVLTPNEAVDYKSLNKEIEKKMEVNKREDTSQPLAADATVDEKTVYYSNMIWLLLRDGKEGEIGKLYVDKIKPENIVFSVDINDIIVRSLIGSNLKQEARPLVEQIISSYKTAKVSNDPAIKNYAQERLEYYETLEKSL